MSDSPFSIRQCSVDGATVALSSSISADDARVYLATVSTGCTPLGEEDVIQLRNIRQLPEIYPYEVIQAVNAHFRNCAGGVRDRVVELAHPSEKVSITTGLLMVIDSVSFFPGVWGQPEVSANDIAKGRAFLAQVKTLEVPLTDEHKRQLAELISKRVVHTTEVVDAIDEYFKLQTTLFFKELNGNS